MNRLFCITGKSASGKDTIYRRLMEDKNIGLKKVIPYTTRPIRDGEVNGREYFFATDEEFGRMRSENRILESRDYNTYYGVWHYFTADDGQIDLEKSSFLIIGTPESCISFRKKFGDALVPLYVYVDDGERLERALRRERSQKNPKYEEMCRRFLGDAQDFAEEKLLEAGITSGFENGNGQFDECLSRIRAEIERKIQEH